MPPQVIPELKYIIRSVTLKEAQDIAQTALMLSTAKEVEEFSQERVKKIVS